MLTFNNAPYVFGGYAISAPTSAVYMYNGVNWVTRAPMLSALDGHGAVALDMNRALICGGSPTNNVATVTASCAIYTVSANSWITTQSMAQARWYFGLVMSEGNAMLV
jgi:hypothetical protein